MTPLTPATAYVRGAMDHRYRTDLRIRAFVSSLLRDRSLTAEDRAELAAQAIRGYVTHRPQPEVDVLAWRRLVGRVDVGVGRAA